jgi:hypothetical protein
MFSLGCMGNVTVVVCSLSLPVKCDFQQPHGGQCPTKKYLSTQNFINFDQQKNYYIFNLKIENIGHQKYKRLKNCIGCCPIYLHSLIIRSKFKINMHHAVCLYRLFINNKYIIITSHIHIVHSKNTFCPLYQNSIIIHETPNILMHIMQLNLKMYAFHILILS